MAENLKEILLEEIALEGLDGITINALNLRLRERPGFPLTVNDQSMLYIWRCVIGLEDIQFYKLQNPRPELLSFNRFHFIDPETRHFLETEHIPDDIYPVVVVEEEGVLGSCPDYKTRENITQTIQGGKIQLKEAHETYGNTLVVVANQDVRVRTILGPDNDAQFSYLNVTYCFLERIARARYNGESSIGKQSLQAMHQNTKSLFYQMKKCRHLGIIRKQRMCSIKKPSNVKLSCVLYHLKRFYLKVGSKQQLELVAMVDHLSKEPEQMCEPSKLKNLLKIYDKDFKRLSQLNVGRERIFDYIDVPYRELHPDATPKDFMTKNGKNERCIRQIRLLKSRAELRRAMDEHDSTDDEGEEEEEAESLTSTLHFNRMFDRPYMFQVVELLRAAGALGLSQVDISKVLNLNRLAARRTVNLLLRTNQVSTVMQDRGRQKVVMYVAVESAEQNQIQQSFRAEMDKYGSSTLLEQMAQFEPYKKRKSDKVRAAEKKVKDEMVCTLNEEPPDGEKISQIHKELDKVDESFCPNLSGLSKETKMKKEILRQIVSEDGTLIQVKLEEIHKIKPNTPVLGLKRFGTMLSESHIRRVNWIIEVVAAIKVVETFRILKLMRNREKEMNMNYSMDSKSLKRLVVALTEEGKLRCFHAQIKMEDKTKDMTYLCSPEVDEKDEFLLRLVEEAKLRYFSVSKEQLHKRRELNKEIVKPQRVVSGVPTTALESIKNHQEYRRKLATRCPPMKYNRRAGTKYGLLPKMLRIQASHQYLFHLCYDTFGKGMSEGGISGNSVKTADTDVTTMNAADKVMQPQVSIKEDIAWPAQDPPVYFDEWTWRRYLPPLPVHAGYSKGWCLLSDVLLRLPVYLFCQIVNVCYDIDNLEEILNDSNKKFYPVINLPWKISQQLLHSKKYVHSFLELCSYLCEMGLLSYGKEFLKEQTFVFVHQNGSLLDTRDSLRGYNKTRTPENHVFPTKKFHFDKLSDLHDYWENLQIISLASNLSFKSKVQDDVKDTARFEKKSLKAAGKSYSPQDIEDDGAIPGDGRGAAGLDSSLFVHCLKNWTFRSLSKTALGGKVYKKTYAPQGLIGGLDMTSKRKVVDMYNKGLKLKGKDRLVLSDDPNNPIEIKKVTKENVKGNKGGRGIKRGDSSSKKMKKREDGRLRLRRVVNYAMPAVPKKKKKASEKGDDKDRWIYKKKTRQRVVWSVKEDSVLLMCRLATFIMDDNRKTSIVAYPVIRDFIHEHCGEVAHDKTSQACNRRLKFVLKNKQTESNLLLYFREAMQDEFIVKNFVAKKYILTDPTIIPNFKRLTNYLIEKFQTLNVQKCTLPATLTLLKDCQKDPLHKMTHVKEYMDATNKEDICKDVLRNILHSAVLLQDKQGRTHEMFKLLTQYPDMLLSDVIKELRRDGLFVIQKKHYQKESLSQLQTGLGLRNFKVSQRYMYNYKHRYLSTLFEESADFLDKLYDSYIDGKGLTLDFHPQGGQSAILIPLVLKKMLTFKMKIPEEFVVIDMDGFYSFPWGRGKIGTTKADKSLQDLYNKKNLGQDISTPTKDTGDTSSQDAGVTPTLQTGVSPTLQTGVTPTLHTGVSPTLQTGVSPTLQTGVSPVEDVVKDVNASVSDEVETQVTGDTAAVASIDQLNGIKQISDNNVDNSNTEEMETENSLGNNNSSEKQDKAVVDETGENINTEAMETEESDVVHDDELIQIENEVSHTIDPNEEAETKKANEGDECPSNQKENTVIGDTVTHNPSSDSVVNENQELRKSKTPRKVEYVELFNGSSTIIMPKYEHKPVNTEPHFEMGASSQASIASRTLLSLRRAEDTSMYSIDDIRIFNAQDNFVVKSCEIEVKIRGESVDKIGKTTDEVKDANNDINKRNAGNGKIVGDGQSNSDLHSATIKQLICDELPVSEPSVTEDARSMTSKLMMHKPKMKRLWNELQRLLPFKLEMKEVWKSLIDNDGISMEELTFYKQVYKTIDSHGELGIKMYDLQKHFVGSYRWKDAVKMLMYYAAHVFLMSCLSMCTTIM